MADDILKGLGDETLREAQLIKEATQDVGENISRWNKLLKDAGYSLVDQNRSINNIKNAADSVASIQEKAAKSAKATKEAFEKQAKLLSNVRELNQKINTLYEQALRPGEQNAKLLLRQAQHLEAARDNAQALADVFEDIGTSAAKLDKSTSFFSQMAAATSSLSKISTPFEKAAEAARKTALENAKNKASVKEMLTTGKGLTAEKAKELGLGEKLLDKNGKLLSGTALTNRLNKLGAVESLASKGAKSVAGAGTKALLGEMFSMSNLLGKAGWIGALFQVGKFIADIFIGAQNRTIEIAKSLGITRESADQLRKQYVDIAGQSSNILVNSQSLVEAQQQFTGYTNAVSRVQADTLENQVFLTKSLQMSGEAAADLSYMMEATNQPASKTTDEVIELNRNFAKAKGFVVPIDKLFNSIAKTSKEIQGYFGFNVKSLAEAVTQVSKFGLELNDTKAIANSLLDFESSLSSELDLELLTQKEFNFERARAYAATGQFAKATEEVLSQMQQLTEEQRQSPILMEAASKATGLTVDQLNRAYLVNRKLRSDAKAYYDLLVSQGKQKEANYAVDLLGEQATKEEMMKTISAQDAFNAALEKAKDQFTGLVSSGALDTLTDAIIRFAEAVGNFTGANERQSQAAAKTIAEGKNYSQEQKSKAATLQEAAKKEGQYKGALTATATGAAIGTVIAPGIGTAIGAGLGFIAGATADYFADEEGAQARKDLLKMRDNPGAKVEDFVIQTHPKDTLALVGGTQLSNNKTVDETNTLLRELISAVKAGGNVYIGPHKLNEAIGLNLHSIS